MTTATETQSRYWIAINRTSCAISRFPMREPKVTPTPEQMFGFPTLEEAEAAQRTCLTAPIEDVANFLDSLLPDVQSGRVVYRRPENPERPTRDETVWMDSNDH